MSELIKPEQVRIKAYVKDWEEAVRISGKLLEDAGCVEHSYVEGMVRGVKEFGPYVAIAPGLAMPHWLRGEGVIQSGISVVTLREPVCFGNEDNDPVHVVIGLAGANDNLHLDILAAIAEIFEDVNKVYEIAEYEDPQAIVNLFNNMEINI